MIKIDEDNIMKVVSINSDQLPKGFFNQIAGFEEYRDKNSLGEHLYSYEELLQREEFFGLSALEAIKEIAVICDKYEASYFRIVKV